MYARLGAITDRSDATMWLCNWTPARWTSMCEIPTKEQIITDPGNYGGHLSDEAKKRAEEIARGYIEVDSSLCELDNTCPFTWNDPRSYGQAPESIADALKSAIPSLPISGTAVLIAGAAAFFFLTRR